MLKTSVVIPVYNGHRFLLANLPAVLALEPDEIIVVDDCSTDDSAEIIRSRFPRIRLIRHAVNTRFPIAVNDGFSAASGDIVILLNQDVQPDKNLIIHTLPHFKSPDVFAVTFNEQGRSWALARLINGFIEYSNGSLDISSHLSFWASGGSAAFRKSDWDQLGGFDPVFTPGYFEDADLGFRSYKRGFKIIWESQARVVHAHPESTFSSTFSSRRLQLIKDRNYLLMHWKNLDSPNLKLHFRSLASRLLRHPGYSIPVFLAFSKLPAVLTFRNHEKTQQKLSDLQVFSRFV